jgi:hypothetical protein
MFQLGNSAPIPYFIKAGFWGETRCFRKVKRGEKTYAY